MAIKKTAILFLVSVLLLIPVSACGGSGLTAIELIPQKSNLILNIEIGDIIDDKDIRDAYNRTEKNPDQPQTADKGLDELFAETGIRLSDFSQAMVFADINDTDYSEYLGFIVEGNFEETQFIENMEKQTNEELQPSEYQGYTLYSDLGEEFFITFLDNETLLAGTEDAVKDVIAIAKGDRKPASGPVLDTYNDLGNPMIKLAVQLPEEARTAMLEETGMEGMPFSFESFSEIDIIGFALDKSNETLNARIDVYFLSAESAEDAKNTISGFISLFKGTVEDQETKDLLGDIEVTASGSKMTIEFDINLPDIENLMETF